MLSLFYAPGACSMAAHIVMEESGEAYQPKRMDLAKGDQKTAAYLKIHPLGRVPALALDDGSYLTENTAILPYLGQRFGLWPTDPLAQVRALSVIGFFATNVHPAFAHIRRPERYTEEASAHAGIQAVGQRMFLSHLHQIDALYADREWLSGRYSVLDPYAWVFYVWGQRIGMPMSDLKNFTALKDRMLQRAAVQRVMADEGLSL
ncbi:MAG: glutathione S-transferase [Limnohabitans sp.]|jgi:glutathione S-transferase|nr:glutathione S-transferase [Limnohabitans sp.]